MTDNDTLPAPASVLFYNEDKTVWLLDLPTSIEETQITSRQACLTRENATTKRRRLRRRRRRLISVPPLEKPFETPGPKARDAMSTASPAAQVNELMTLAAVEHALQVLKEEYQGPWCLPRHLHRQVGDGDTIMHGQSEGETTTASQSNTEPEEIAGQVFTPHSHALNGTIASHLPTLKSPSFNSKFNLIMLDPPWPNRSATRRRRGHDSSSSTSYTTASTPSSLRALLTSIPIPHILTPGGTVAIWLTNSLALEDLLTNSKHGVLREWGLEVVDTWTWLKVTSRGEPVVDLESKMRRPWERLLFARRIGEQTIEGGHGDRRGMGRVIVAVPEAHSRKPSLRGLLEDYLGFEATVSDEQPGGYEALEVFARNLTAGWWGWGDEVLGFQGDEFWCEDEECGCAS